MPELPDVEIYRRYLEATSLRQKIRLTTVTDRRLLRGITPARLQSRTKARCLDSTRRHGKYLFAALDRGCGWLVFHFGMTGDLTYSKGGGSEGYVRVIFDFTNGYRLLFRDKRRLGGLWLVKEPDSFILRKGLGPDALRMDRSAFARMLAKGRGSIKPLLMNQKAIAGIGNIYADEILFQSGIHPASRADKLEQDRAAKLYRNILLVLETAVRDQADPGRFPASYLLRGRHEGAICSRCGSRIEKMKISGRTAYFCPQCQKRYF